MLCIYIEWLTASDTLNLWALTRWPVMLNDGIHFKESVTISELCCSGLNVFNQCYQDFPRGVLTATLLERATLPILQSPLPLARSLISTSQHTLQGATALTWKWKNRADVPFSWAPHETL